MAGDFWLGVSTSEKIGLSIAAVLGVVFVGIGISVVVTCRGVHSRCRASRCPDGGVAELLRDVEGERLRCGCAQSPVWVQ